MIKRMIIMLVVVGIVLGGIIGFEAYRPIMIRNYISSQPEPAQTVSTIQASYQDWQPSVSAVGSLKAVNGTDLASEVAGIVETINFKSGDEVAAGTLLIKLRAEDDIGKLHSLQASAELARIVQDRDQKQFKAQAVSQATLDSDAANLKNMLAQVEEQQAVVDKKMIRAPFAGRLGIRSVDLGQYLAAGTSVVTLQQLDPIFFDFYLPEQSLADLKVGSSVRVRVQSLNDRVFEGQVAAINPTVETTSRNTLVRATLANPDKALVPGMFGTADVTSGQKQRYLTLPQAAVAYNTYGSTVFIVRPKPGDTSSSPPLVANQTFITTGPTRGDQIAVLTGLKEGDTVVTAGQIKIHSGSVVAINNTVQPDNDPDPKPVEE
jgi:membrane fusion protein (multidrug efflux system)